MLASYLNWIEKQISNLGVMSSSLIEATRKKIKEYLHIPKNISIFASETTTSQRGMVRNTTVLSASEQPPVMVVVSRRDRAVGDMHTHERSSSVCAAGRYGKPPKLAPLAERLCNGLLIRAVNIRDIGSNPIGCTKNVLS